MSNNFQYAIQKVLQNEGRYSTNPSDPGGETYCGISRVSWPNWQGWPVIDTCKGVPAFPSNLSGAAGLDDLVKSFYRTNFWHFDGIVDADVAEKVLDICVNLGTDRAVRVLQTALRGIGEAVALDGSYGPATEAAVNAAKTDTLLLELRAQQAYHYATTAKSVFLLGLLRRAVR